jgi:hypothetical protein
MKNMFIILLLVLTVLVSGCTGESNATQAQNIQNAQSNLGMSSIGTADVQKVEIYHFHGTNQCASCIAVGDLAEETINTYFADEVKSGKIVFGHINGDLPENAALVKQYGATGSSLWIGTYTVDGQFKAEQNVNVWYKISNKKAYMDYLKSVIDKRLVGDYS